MVLKKINIIVLNLLNITGFFNFVQASTNFVDCSEYIDCFECGKAQGCAWCHINQTCETEDQILPQLLTCPDLDVNCDACSQLETCNSCTNKAGCAWCMETQSCKPEHDGCSNYELICSNEDPCNSAKSCWDCSLRENCGWCRSTQQCLTGDIDSPKFAVCDSWDYYCSSRCRSRLTCNECVGGRQECVWCFNSNKCVQAVDHEYEIYAGDECSDTAYYDYFCPYECSVYKDCESCAADSSCGWCEASGECIPGEEDGPTYDYGVNPVCESYSYLQSECARFEDLQNLRCNSYRCPFPAYRKRDRRCINSINDCNCPMSYKMNIENEACERCDTYDCPENSSPKAETRCIRRFEDCECDIGTKADRRSETCNLCDTFACPLNSRPKLGERCITKFDDCECNFGTRRKRDTCVKCRTYECPLHSEPKEGRSCIESFSDCECEDRFKKNKRDKVCEPCDNFQCPQNSKRREGVQCVKNFNDCICEPGTSRREASCMNCFEYVGRGHCGNAKSSPIFEIEDLASEQISLEECKELCLNSGICRGLSFNSPFGRGKGECSAVLESPSLVSGGASQSCFNNLCANLIKK